MAIVFPFTFANLSGNVPASDLDACFTYCTTLAANATLASSLTGTELILLSQGGAAFSATIAQIVAAVGSGTATQANQLTTGRTISLTGDVTYTSPTFNGTANVSAAATVISATTAVAGKVQLAQASDVTTGTSNSLAVTPASLSGFPAGAKAFVRWTGQVTNGACAIVKSFNVTSVTRYGGGSYTIAFTNPMSDVNYVVNATVNLWSGGSMMVGLVYSPAPTAGSFSITSTDLSNNGRDVSIYCITVFD